MKSWDVSVVGEVLADHVLSGFENWPKPGEEVVTDQYTREVGGGAAITACGLSRLGRSVNLVAVIGAIDGGWFEHRLGAFGVGADGLRKVEGNTGTTISVSTAADRSFFTYAGANRRLAEALHKPDALAQLSQSRHVHFAMPLARSLAGELLRALSAAGCTMSLDVGFQPHWLRDPANLNSCRAVDYLLPNEKEAALLCGSDKPEEFVAFAQKAQLRSCALKLGARGALSIDEGMLRSVAAPPVAALDPTGAGDAFDAGFIDALLDEVSVEERLRRACICGALSTRFAGALAGLPDREELWNVYEQTYGS